MNFEAKLMEELKKAIKEKDQVRVSVIKLLRAELKNAKIAKMADLTEEDFIKILRKEVKKREEAIEMYRKGGREDLAKQEEEELKILKEYLPPELSEAELERIIDEAIEKVGATSMKDMGKVMKEVMAKVAGRADGSKVSAMVRSKLGG